MDTRGLVIGPGESYEQLYLERQPLYEKFAEITISGGGMTVEAVAAAIEEQVCG
jgi:shikimate kinase